MLYDQCISQVKTLKDSDGKHVTMRLTANDDFSRYWSLYTAAPELLEALYVALPYVETELDSGCYKKGTKEKVLKQIMDAIKKAGE